MSTNIYILIICDLPEIEKYKDMNTMGHEILQSFKFIANKNNKKLNVIDIISCGTANKCINGLKKMAKYLNKPGNKGIVYYYGHGDRMKELNSIDTAEHMIDEKCTSPGIFGELSYTFNTIHPTSILYIFSDSLSSNQLIDRKLNNRNWITISSSTDLKDCMATRDIGVFTIWGIFPALEALYNPSPVELHAFIKSNISIDTLIIFDSGNPAMINQRMF